MTTSLIIVSCYLLGSIPFGFLIAWAKGIDIRQFGSGNIGATNVGRALGRPFGFLVFALDFLKGFGPVLAIRLLGHALGDTPFIQYDLRVCGALAAILGHTFSVWLKFRGGKAGATGLGVGAVLDWRAMVLAAVAWCLVFFITRYVSLGTMLGGVAYSATYIALAFYEGSPFDREHRSMTAFCVFASVLVIVRHWSNILRLMNGTESKL